ncbi:hypothetical protein [Ectobacillus ponti]|uniref:Uncharacterized protein n=1 Tax=Ectobacillus ponti TaxID=2961894 RepID=A0AA42BR60_9BACI|nr:hypothetical protein [Ectobacillus ponti]MCP8970076.1 hypothetical protein [Ectobacillus ponti]
MGSVKIRKIRMFILCLYCFPFVYAAMYQDFQNRSMLGHLLVIAALFLIVVSVFDLLPQLLEIRLAKGKR